MPKDRTDKPNVIVFFTDQQRWDASGLHGNPLDLMPNFDRMALAGAHCANAFTCQPVCGPARAVLQTGLHATAAGVWRNGIPLRPDQKTLAHHFNDAGYDTGYIGKWHLASTDPVPPEERGGYEYWLGANVLEFCSQEYNCVMYDGDGKPIKLPGYRVDAQTDAAIRYIDGRQDDPFFLFLSYLEPHFQNHVDDYPPPDGYREKYDGRWVPSDLAALGGSTHQHLGGYWGMVKRLDEALGRILDALKSLGIADNTIVLFTSDHACHFKTRNSEYKRSCHESSIRIPTAITGPGFMGGGQISQLVSLVDLPPTLLDAAGIPVPEDMQGHSILPLTRGEAEGFPDEMFVQISEAQVGRCVRTHRWKYSVIADEPDTGGGADTYREEFLYDLAYDPHELDNRIHLDSHRKVADVMRERLIRRMLAAGERAPTIIPAESHGSGQRRVDAAEELL
ncbi:sulfatase-like hydrolase/transferase [bacterium]|nr:sulfatase-like hydrolase/transferase [bacterium]